MTLRLLKGGDVLLSDGRIQRRDILVHSETILTIGPDLNEEKADYVDNCSGLLIAPGLCDMQANGGDSVLFNDDPSTDGLRRIARAHLKLGTTQLLPTLVSDTLEVVRKGIAAVDGAIANDVTSIVGIHIEGPFLSPEKRGIHRRDDLRKLEDADVELLSSLKNGVTLVTVAPEQVSPDQIRALVANGVIVSLGHSNTTSAKAAAAFEAGASGVTHLYNGMSQLSGREPGMVGAALTHDDVWTSLILDGHHLARASTELVFRAKPKRKCILITDAMPVAGTEATSFMLQGKKISVKDGRCIDERGTLAGAALSLPEAIRHALTYEQVSRENAIEMASRNPAEFLMLDKKHGQIEIGRQADLVCFNSDLECKQVMHLGQWVIKRTASDGFQIGV